MFLLPWCAPVFGVLFPKMLGNNSLLLRFGFRNRFLVLFCLCSCFLVGVLVPKMLGKSSLLLRSGFRNPFSGTNFCFCFLIGSGVFRLRVAHVFACLFFFALP